MAITDKHPLYAEFLDDWTTMRDTYRGERVVKAAGERYLPATSGMHADGMQMNQPGRRAYDAYVKRAVFRDYVAWAVETLLGVMHDKPPKIELPPQLEPLRERATLQGESLQMLLRRINCEQLVTGRLGLLADLPSTPTVGRALPYLALYRAETIVNWDAGRPDLNQTEKLRLVVLDESGYKRDSQFAWSTHSAFRVLALGDAANLEEQPNAPYRAGVFETTGQSGITYSDAAMTTPNVQGRQLDQIPFVFCNTADVVAEPDDPSLIGLAKLTLAIYRGEADYRQALFMQGQDTLVITGAPPLTPGEQRRVGANATIELAIGGDAKFIGVDGGGLSEMRESLENDRKEAASHGGQLLGGGSGQKESGDALQTRVSAQTATLNQVALSGAFALENALKIVALWVGADPEKVKVEPNLDFDAALMTGQELSQFVSAKNMGAPLSRESLHKLMMKRGVTDMEYEKELEALENEPPLGPPLDPATGRPRVMKVGEVDPETGEPITAPEKPGAKKQPVPSK